jgi:hypothetical protein
MAAFLEQASPAVRESVGVTAAESRQPAALPRPVDVSVSRDLPSFGSELQRLHEVERGLQARFPDSEKGRLIRRYVALSMAEMEVEGSEELSGRGVVAELMKDPLASAQEARAVLGGLGSEAELERSAVLKLMDPIGTSAQALPVVDAILRTEIQRVIHPSALDSEHREARFSRLINDYGARVCEVDKQIQFLKLGLASQSDARLRELLEARLEALSRIGPAPAAEQWVSSDAAPAGEMSQ